MLQSTMRVGPTKRKCRRNFQSPLYIFVETFYQVVRSADQFSGLPLALALIQEVSLLVGIYEIVS